MSLLEDVRKLPYRRIHEYRGNGDYSCVLCGWSATRADLDQPDMARVHTGDCVWLSMPKIVAVLEAVEAYVQEMEGQGEHVDVLRRIQTYRALVTALRGEPE